MKNREYMGAVAVILALAVSAALLMFTWSRIPHADPECEEDTKLFGVGGFYHTDTWVCREPSRLETTVLVDGKVIQVACRCPVKSLQ